ncbi:signal recognition particle protein Srp19 [Thermococcus nautili]|uniref:Signal recognition particle 19 kDa protein n=1 Tax=Thermococcus nautili TaxID=195522 RepID=W8P3E0_9EURY|nr:signal recognition particle protein Srp19 [Thermococcus nautili]AHL23281.1 Signal recognition particle 19 kDa protein [Thermococcus nautili]CAI1493082.1 Signal recognition particle 19 kDa protein [Thermococcus nautili]
MKFAVWPSELDARLSRKYGRTVPKNVAVDAPKLSEIEDAVLILGMKVIEKDHSKLNPRLSGLDEELRTYGFLRVESPYGKGKSLKMIAEKIRELRSRAKSKKGKAKRKRR